MRQTDTGLERLACGPQGGDRAKGTDMEDTGGIWGDTDSKLVPLSEAGKELRGGSGLGEIMNLALEPAGVGAINPRGEGGRFAACWLSTCAACSECPSNRLRDLCKSECAGALIGLRGSCPGASPQFLHSTLALSSRSLMKSPRQNGGFKHDYAGT